MPVADPLGAVLVPADPVVPVVPVAPLPVVEVVPVPDVPVPVVPLGVQLLAVVLAEVEVPGVVVEDEVEVLGFAVLAPALLFVVADGGQLFIPVLVVPLAAPEFPVVVPAAPVVLLV